MEIKQLNCTACGAPISIPENVDQLNCSSCGSFLQVQRGEGYVALKMVEKVAQVIQDSAYVTQSELKKLQVGQEISMLEMQLSSIRGEIRGLMRATPEPRILQQLQDLYIQEYTLLERLRQNHWTKASMSLPDPDHDLETLQSQFSFIQNEIAAVKQVTSSNQQNQELIQKLEAHGQNLADKILNLKIEALKKSLKSFPLKQQPASDQEETQSEIAILEADIQTLSAQPESPETEAVLAELGQRRTSLLQQWHDFENQRVSSALGSKNLTKPTSSDLAQAREELAQIRADIQMLEGWPQNDEVEAHLSQLKKKEKDFSRHLRKLEKGARSGQNKEEGISGGFFSFLGFSAARRDETIASRATVLPEQDTASGNPATALPGEEGRTLWQRPETPSQANQEDVPLSSGTTLLKGCVLAVIPLFSMSCLGFLAYGFINSWDPKTTATLGIGVFFSGVWIGYILGVLKFFQVFRQHKKLGAVLAGGAGWVGVYFLTFVILGFIDPPNDALSNNVIGLGFFSGPVIGLGILLYQLKPEAPIWKPVHSLLARF